MTKRELIEFLDGLVELASEENKEKAVLVKEKFINSLSSAAPPFLFRFLPLFCFHSLDIFMIVNQ